MDATIWVARLYSWRVARIARSARPPSIGNAGIKLNATKNKFTARMRWRKGPVVNVNVCMGSNDAVNFSHTNNTAAMATFTAGPANATHNSCRGLVGRLSRRATPPMGNKTMSRVLIPYGRVRRRRQPDRWLRAGQSDHRRNLMLSFKYGINKKMNFQHSTFGVRGSRFKGFRPLEDQLFRPSVLI